jgi:hypothetical protein
VDVAARPKLSAMPSVGAGALKRLTKLFSMERWTAATALTTTTSRRSTNSSSGWGDADTARVDDTDLLLGLGAHYSHSSLNTTRRAQDV